MSCRDAIANQAAGFIRKPKARLESLTAKEHYAKAKCKKTKKPDDTPGDSEQFPRRQKQDLPNLLPAPATQLGMGNCSDHGHDAGSTQVRDFHRLGIIDVTS